MDPLSAQNLPQPGQYSMLQSPMEWIQSYDPLGNAWLSTLAAAFPVIVLLGSLALLDWPAHRAAIAGLLSALLVSIVIYGMPIPAALATALYGAAYGLFPICWIIVNAIFLYSLTVETGQFEIVKASVAALSDDPRVQALLIAFSFGAFIEGAAGFGTPVAISSALLLGLGFPPLYAAGLALIANTAPVAFGAIGTPILTLGAITGIPPMTLGMMAGRQLPFVSLLIPAWMIVTMSGWRGLGAVWPAVLAAGGSFAVAQFVWSNYIGPELTDIIGGLVSLSSLAALLLVWRPRDRWAFDDSASAPRPAAIMRYSRSQLVRAWMPWIFLSVTVTAWGMAPVKRALTSPVLSPVVDVPSLHRMVYRDYPVEATAVDRQRAHDPAYRNQRAEAARFTFNWASATGTSILLAAIATMLYLRVPWQTSLRIARTTLVRLRPALLTIAAMLAVGYVTRYGGTDATLGLAFTQTGVCYPFFAAMLGWLGVALTGSDTSSNVLFGSLQKITAQQLGLNPVLITTANSTGGVMGKMIDAQSIVVATASTQQVGQEGRILRFVFWHSIALATIMGVIVLLQAYVFPWMVPSNP
jgi:lactate permease